MLGRDVGREHRRHRLHPLAVCLVGNRLGRVGHLALAVGLGRHRGLDDGMHGLAGLAVQDIEPTVLVGLREGLDRLAVDDHVEQDRLLAVVVVPDVVVHLLVVPGELSRLEIQRDDRVGEQVGAGPLRAVAEGVPDRGVEQAELGVDGRRLPDAPAVAPAADPGRAGDVPALVVLVLRNGVEVPDDLAGLRVDGEHVAARDHALAAGRADVEDAVVDLRGAREPVTHGDGRLHVGVAQPEHVEDDAGLPVLAEALDGLAGLGVEREHERAGGAVDDPVGVGDAAVAEDVALAAAAAEQLRHVVDPQQVPVGGVDRVDAAPRVGDVHDAVDDDRGRLVADAVDDPVLEEPPRGEQVRVLGRDPIRLGVPAPGQVEVVERPVDVLGRGSPCEQGEHAQAGDGGADRLHRFFLQPPPGGIESRSGGVPCRDCKRADAFGTTRPAWVAGRIDPRKAA